MIKFEKFNVVVTVDDGDSFFCTNRYFPTLSEAVEFRDAVANLGTFGVCSLVSGDWVERGNKPQKIERHELETLKAGVTVEIFALADGAPVSALETVEL